MRTPVLLAFFFAMAFPGLCQSQTNSTSQLLPKDPRAIFADAAPFYDFTDASLKPWHLRATYQLYDEDGKPTEQGIYEYWWASPKVYRSTWTRQGVSHTDWHTADGKHSYRDTGGALEFFEYELQSALLTPLPGPEELNASKFRLDREFITLNHAKFPCVMVIPLMPQHGQVQTAPLGLFPTYCFDPNLPALHFAYSWGSLTMEFSHLVEVQGKYLAREILFFEGKHRILTATVDTLTGISSSDPALTPAPDAAVVRPGKVQIAASIATGQLIKKQLPIYPQDAKDAHVSGTVVIQATIGRDGGVLEMRVVEAPWPSLVASAMWAVSHWQYKPYLLNGEPVEVETTINVIYRLGPY